MKIATRPRVMLDTIEFRKQVLQERRECAVCFECPMVRPVVQNTCHHAYCISCLEHWKAVQVQSRSKFGLTVNEDGLSFQNSAIPTCPLRREEIPHMAHSVVQEVIKLVSAAQKEDASQNGPFERNRNVRGRCKTKTQI